MTLSQYTHTAHTESTVAAVARGPELPLDGKLVRVRHVPQRSRHGSLICTGWATVSDV
jgi:hypothetical protein